jgi:plastocyanin
MTDKRTGVGRRRVLLGTGSLVVAGLAGCSGGGDDGGNGGDDGENGGDGGDGNGGDDGENGEPERTRTEGATEITVQANEFNPEFQEVEPGSVVRWEHIGGTHTMTFYHEDNDKPHRVPEGVEAVDEEINSGTEFFEATLDTPGVYDYFCRFHEGSQMIGTLVVGENDDPDQPGLQEPSDEHEPFVRQKLEQLNSQARDVLGI